jgi:putative transposase
MKRQIGYRFRIYPTIEQMIFFAIHFGCVRFIYNYLLVYMTEFYEQNKKSVSIFEAKK